MSDQKYRDQARAELFKKYPACIGFPDCDGDLEAMPHEPGCPWFGKKRPSWCEIAVSQAERVLELEDKLRDIEDGMRISREEVERNLQAMTEDRNLWQYAHNDDCPNINIVDTLTEQLATAKAEARREALEEAARIAANRGKKTRIGPAISVCDDIASAILALAQEKKA